MFAAFGSTQVMASVIAEQMRGRAVLAELCGLEADRSVENCGRKWCGYFDDEQQRCGLLRLNVHERMGDDALRWFVSHRTTKPLEQDARVEALAMRVGAL